MKKIICSILVVVALIVSVGISFAESINCNHNYVYEGDDVTKLESICGSPDSVTSKVVARGDGRNSVATTVYTYTYNCGEYRHIKKVVVENDKIRNIYSGDVGTGKNYRCENNG